MIVIGTAGHIDHGKTSLVAALTGIKTDRLKEEQARGISIELGFAYIDTSDGQRLGIVDVPGHERFVRQMIAGATGIDLVLLVVAADEGVMQQTREHLDICRLLGISRGAVVLTKTDLVDEEWLELVESDVADFVEGTFLEGAPVLHFSAPNENTHAPVMNMIEQMAKELSGGSDADSDEEPLRLPVDRVFTMKGFGTVVTGTVCSGSVSVGDNIVVLPNGLKAKVRGIQSHNQSVESIGAGHRAAINLQGIERESISRGDVIGHPDVLKPSRMIDIDLLLLPHVPRGLESQAKGLVHVGTSQINGTVVLLDRDILNPGDTAPAQIRLDQYCVGLGGEHVILRGFDLLPTYGKTLGGGVIRHPIPPKHRSNQPHVLEALTALRSGNRSAMIEQSIRLAGHAGIRDPELAQITHLSTRQAQAAAQLLISTENVYSYVEDGKTTYIHDSSFSEMLQRAENVLDEYHKKYPHRAGIPREELRSQIRSDLPARYFTELASTLESRSAIVSSGRVFRRSDFQPTLNQVQKDLMATLCKRYEESKLEPPTLSAVLEDVCKNHNTKLSDAKEIIDLLVSEGTLHRVTESLVFANTHIEWVETQVRQFLEKHGEMTTPQLKEITGTSRKFTVPLAEYLDARKVTIRVKEVRRLR